MSILDKFKFKKKEVNLNTESVGTTLNETANEIIKRMSGGEIKHTRKLVDNLVVITNTAGGTGASTIVANTAKLASEEGMRVMVIDLNIMLPSQHNYFGIKQEIEKDDLVSFINGESSLGESIVTKNGISLFYANNRGLVDYINSESDIAINNFNEAIINMRSLYDLILVDAPMRIEHALINDVMYKCDQMYAVWDEGISSVANTERLRRNLALSGVDVYTKMRVILNKRTSIGYSEYPFKKLDIDLVGILPFDSGVIDASLKSKIFCTDYSSGAETANEFYTELKKITLKILEIGGFIGNGSKETVGDTD